MRRPRLSLILPVHATPVEATLGAARAAEAAGLDGVWVPDALVPIGDTPLDLIECWTLLSALAATTRAIRLGPLVLTTAFRHPPLLAKQVATLEALAPGRIVLGLGAGGFTYTKACSQYGFPVLAGAERVAHVEETILCLRRAWNDEPAAFAGRFARIQDMRLRPRPARTLPIVLAARRPRMLDLAARLADGWNCPLPQELHPGLAALRRAGRDPATLEVSVYAVGALGESDAKAGRALERAGPGARLFGDVERHHVFGSPERAAARLAALADAGADEVTLDVRGTPPAAAIELLARDVLPRLER